MGVPLLGTGALGTTGSARHHCREDEEGDATAHEWLHERGETVMEQTYAGAVEVRGARDDPHTRTARRVIEPGRPRAHQTGLYGTGAIAAEE